MKLEHTMNRLTDVIMPFATKVAENNYVKSLSESMQLLLPITITGSFAALFAFIDIGPWQDFLASNEIFALVLKNIQAWTTNLIAFFLAIILPYRYAENVGMKNAIGVVCAVMAGFLLLTPNEINVAMPVEWLGHKGMFTVMILSFIATRVMKIFIDRNWTIRMPAGVPKAIEGAFLDLIPAAVIIIICGIIGQLMALTDFRTVHQFIYTLIQIPVSNIGLSFGGLIIFETIATVSMFFGIHGEATTAWFKPLLQTSRAENLAAFSAGEAIPHVLDINVVGLEKVGGIGSTLGLAILLLLFARSQRFKKLARVSIVPQIFNITEPLLFGIPIMLNPILFIPYLGTVLVNCSVVYGSIFFGLVGRSNGVEMAWTVPSFIKALLANTTPIQAFIMSILLIVIDMLIWYPFMRMIDRQALKEEKEAQAEMIHAPQPEK